MKKADQIREALRRCSGVADCSQCPYRGRDCIERMCADALEYFEQLEAELQATKDDFDEYARQY